MPTYTAIREATGLITQMGFKGLIAASTRFEDEVFALKEAGVNAAYNSLMKAAPAWPMPLKKNLKVK